jgi:hypothetical protein
LATAAPAAAAAVVSAAAPAPGNPKALTTSAEPGEDNSEAQKTAAAPARPPVSGNGTGRSEPREQPGSAANDASGPMDTESNPGEGNSEAQKVAAAAASAEPRFRVGDKVGYQLDGAWEKGEVCEVLSEGPPRYKVQLCKTKKTVECDENDLLLQQGHPETESNPGEDNSEAQKTAAAPARPPVSGNGTGRSEPREQPDPAADDASELSADQLKELEELFPDAYTCENGSSSLNCICFPDVDENHTPCQTFDTFDTFKATDVFRMSRDNLDAHLRNHKIGTRDGGFAKTVSKAFKKNFRNPDHSHTKFDMLKWVLKRCSEKTKETGTGFLDIPTVSDAPRESWDVKEQQLSEHGTVPFRRHGHPEAQKVDHIPRGECWRLQVANACGEDLLTRSMVDECNPTIDTAMDPALKHIAQALDQKTPLMLQLKPDLCGNLTCMHESTGMFMLETIWPDQPRGHVLLYDAERKYLMMGCCNDSPEQTTLQPEPVDLGNELTNLKHQYGFDFEVREVYQVMVKTRRMSKLPLTALKPPPPTQKQLEKQRKKELKRKAWEEKMRQAPAPKIQKTDPENFRLKCCICHAIFTGAGHNPHGYMYRESRRRPYSRYGDQESRCCSHCNTTKVMRWRGETGMP